SWSRTAADSTISTSRPRRGRTSTRAPSARTPRAPLIRREFAAAVSFGRGLLGPEQLLPGRDVDDPIKQCIQPIAVAQGGDAGLHLRAGGAESPPTQAQEHL